MALDGTEATMNASQQCFSSHAPPGIYLVMNAFELVFII